MGHEFAVHIQARNPRCSDSLSYSWHFLEPMWAVDIPGFIQQINYYAVCFVRAWAENQVSL